MQDSNPKVRSIAVAKGDGIGPEIMEAVLKIFQAAQVPLQYDFVEMGKSVFEAGQSTGMTEEARQIIERHGILFKGPMETPKGKGVKSINVTARKVWNTFANVRKFRSLKGVDTVFSRAGVPVNMTILRENIEDTYGGIEYMHTNDVAVTYRMITRPGCEQFARYAFEFARKNGCRKLTCAHKSNIMKLTDGMFMNTFYQIAPEYPDIELNDLIVDDLAMKLVRMPDQFELVALTNLQGDIISDLCAGLVGGLGFAPSANIGENISIFEAVHGTAPDIAGKGIANPSALLMSGIMMLRHLGLPQHAAAIENALYQAVEEGVHTGDFGPDRSKAMGTKQFAEEIASRIQVPTEAEAPTPHKPMQLEQNIMRYTQQGDMRIDGMDIFIKSTEQPGKVAEELKAILPQTMRLLMVSNRGTQVYPNKSIYTELVAHHRCRIEAADASAAIGIPTFLAAAEQISRKMEVLDIEILKSWGDMRGYSLAQGQ